MLITIISVIEMSGDLDWNCFQYIKKTKSLLKEVMLLVVVLT